MMITEIVIKDVRCIEAARLTIPPETYLIQISGDNGSGKSSILNAIAAVLAGPGHVPADMLRHGAEKGMIEITLGADDGDGVKYIARLPVKKGGLGQLSIKRSDGKALKRTPRKAMELILNPIGISPTKFADAKPADRVAMLLATVEPGFDLAGHKRKKRELEQARADHGRDKTRIEGAIASLPPVPADTPDEEVSVADIMAELEEAQKANAANEKMRDTVPAWADAVTAKRNCAENTEMEITILRDRLAEEELAAKRAEAALQQAKDDCAALPDDIELAPIRARVEAGGETNRAVQAKQTLAKHGKELAGATRCWGAADKEVKDHEEHKTDVFKGIKLPFDDVAITEESIRIDGTELSALSRGERVLAGVSIAAQGKRAAKVILVEDGSDLDEHTMAAIKAIAETTKTLIIVEQIQPAQCGFRVVGGVVEEVTQETS